MPSPQRILILLTLVNLLNYLDRYVVAAVLVPIGRELHLGDSELGDLPLTFLVVYMLAAPIFGWLADRFHRPRLIAAGIAIWSLATMGAAFVHSFGGLLVTRSLVGVGEAAYASLGPAVLSDCFHESERARRFTWFYLAIPVGSALGYAVGGVVGQHFGWRAAFLVAGLPGLFFAWRLSRMADPERGAMDAPHEAHALASMSERVRAIFVNRVYLACTASYVAYTFAMGVLTTWGPAMATRKFGVSSGEAGTVFGAIAAATGIVGTFVGGFATDALEKRWPNVGIDVSAVTLVLAAPLVFFGLHAGSTLAMYVFFGLGMLFLFVNTSPVNAITVSSLPAAVRATGMAVNILLIHLLGDAGSPKLAGMLTDVAHAAGADPGTATARGMSIAVPAIVVAGLVLLLARKAALPPAAPARTLEA